MKLDVVMCVGLEDIHHLFLCSIASCVKNLEGLQRIIIVTPDRDQVNMKLRQATNLTIPLVVLEDSEILPAPYLELPGWSRQQAIKLFADQISQARYVACMGADTVMLQEVGTADLFVDETPIIYYNRYPYDAPHLDYERTRVMHISRILQVDPIRSFPLGDFIMDFMVFDPRILRQLRNYLEVTQGPEPLLTCLPVDCTTLRDKVRFSEWTLYSVFLLDVLKADVPVRNSNFNHVAQLHTPSDLDRFQFNSRIVHFVDKKLDRDLILKRLDGIGFSRYKTSLVQD